MQLFCVALLYGIITLTAVNVILLVSFDTETNG